MSEDERWIAQEWLSELVAAFEDDPQGVAESVAATAIGYGAEAWVRGYCRRRIGLLWRVCWGMMAIVLPGWVVQEVAGAI